ncbi:MAG: DUF5071 domain-containing protein [Leptospirales bacterium]|nr:DUF5071 domain-containing protein [Leptospirales bacterium]
MDIDTLIGRLNAAHADGHPELIQKAAIMELSQKLRDDDLPKLLQPLTKAHWENAAQVLKLIGFPRIKRIEDGLVRWLRDINWPGARTVRTILLTLRDEEFVPLISRNLLLALSENDLDWLEPLQSLIEEKRVGEKFSTDLQSIIRSTDRNV